MTQLSPTALEEAAKAGAPELLKDHDNLTPTERALWEAGLTAKQFIAREKTAAAITAYLAQREKEGWVMVPVEPTLVMMEAAGKAVAAYIEKMTASGGAIEASDYALRAVVHRAMLAAAQNGGE